MNSDSFEAFTLLNERRLDPLQLSGESSRPVDNRYYL